MTRRVIFPDPDIWTQKENTMTDNTTGPGDYRRAAVLTLHHRQGNLPGVLAIVDEVNDNNRGPHLLLGILGLHGGYISRLRTQDGISLLADYVHGMASLDATEPPGTDIVQAAQIFEYHGLNDFDGIDRVLKASVNDERATEVFLQLMDLYEVTLPELSAPNGIHWLEEQIKVLANDEVTPDEETNQ